MSIRFLGGIITNNATQPTLSSAKGVWTLSQQSQAKYANAWPLGTIPDPQFNYVTALLNDNGINGAQNNTFVDSSTNNFTITRNGNTTQGSFSPYGPNWSNYFDGSSAKITLPSLTAMNLDGQFTIECWVYWSGTSLYYQNFVGSNNTFTSNASYFRVWGTGAPSGLANKIGIGNPTHDGEAGVYSVNNLTANTWVHVAATRDNSNIIRVFINGNLERTGSTDSSVYNFGQGGTCIGDSPWDGAQGWYSGYISNLRIIKNSCLYTSSFTPSTTSLTAITNTSLLTCQSNRFVDNSSNAFAITASGSPSIQRFNPFGTSTDYSTSVIGGSGYFDGTGDYLSLAGINLGSGDFTIEGWIYPTNSAVGTTQVIYCSTGAGTQSRVTLQLSTSMVLQSYIRNSDATNIVTYSGSGAVPVNTWSHVAVVRNSGNIYLYVNGILNNTPASSTQNISTNVTATYIGSVSTSAQLFFGNISNLRVNTTAVYTSAFTPPTAPLTAITNTSLLLDMTNAGIYDSAMMDNLETGGNAQVSTSVVKYGTSSINFDGNGDYLNLKWGSEFAFGAGSFTIEVWINVRSFATIQSIIDFRPLTVNGYYPSLFINTSGTPYFVTNNTQVLVPTATITLNTWNHIALVKSGSTTKMYFNGVSVGTYADTNTYLVGADSPVIGVNGIARNTNYFNGYMYDLRITNGYARYTANFTPPTQALPTFGPV